MSMIRWWTSPESYCSLEKCAALATAERANKGEMYFIMMAAVRRDFWDRVALSTNEQV
jgi:hypothetical protein